MTAEGGYAKEYAAGYGGEALKYHQTESRDKDHTISSWKTQLPKGHINMDRDINAVAVQVQSYAAPAYKAPAYSAPAYKAPEYKV